jgi:hypothetical protein
MTAPYGFRLVGEFYGRRRLVDWWAALRAYAAGDVRAALDEPSYLSAFCYPADFAAHLDGTGTPKGYAGPAAAPFVWFDIDKGDDLEQKGFTSACLSATWPLRPWRRRASSADSLTRRPAALAWLSIRQSMTAFARSALRTLGIRKPGCSSGD